jgi:hypothetical protein
MLQPAHRSAIVGLLLAGLWEDVQTFLRNEIIPP